MNAGELIKYTKDLEKRVSLLESVLANAGMIRITPDGIKVPRVERFYVTEGKPTPSYVLDDSGMVEFF